MPLIPIASNKSVQFPVGYYLFKLKSMTEEAPQPGAVDMNGRPAGPRCKWAFLVERVMETEPTEEQLDQVGQEFWCWTTISMGKKANMRAYVEGLMGRQIEDGEQVDEDDLIGRRAKASIVTYVKQDQTTGTKLGALTPYTPRAKQVVPVTAAPPVEEERAADDGDDLPF